MLEGFTVDDFNLLNIFLLIDILQFAGLAYIIMAFFREFNLGKYWLLIIAFAITLLSPLLWGVKTELPIVSRFLDLIWGDLPSDNGFIGNGVCFPLFPWLSFPLLGMVIGDYFKNTTVLNNAYRKTGIIGFVVLVLGIIITLTNIEYHYKEYYHSRQGFMIFMLGFIMTWLYLCNLLIRKIPNNKVFELLFDWSRNVTNIYFIQWVLIAWGIAIFSTNESQYLMTIVLMLFIGIASHLLSKTIAKEKLFLRNFPHLKKNR